MTNTVTIQNNTKNRGLWVPVLVSICITQFLFFIDEGYYDFRWMKSFGNWIVFFIYAGFLFGGQVLIKWLFFRKKGYVVMTAVLGVMVGLAIALLVFSGAWR